jgi:hypothetical protein
MAVGGSQQGGRGRKGKKGREREGKTRRVDFLNPTFCAFPFFIRAQFLM